MAKEITKIQGTPHIIPLEEYGEKVTVASTIYETYDYSIFKNSVVQRSTTRTKVEFIKNRIQDRLMPIPIMVNNHMEIIDGHNTLQARKELSLPILFHIYGKGDESDAERVNLGRTNWTIKDLIGSKLKSNETPGNIGYVCSIIREYNISITLAKLFLTGSITTSNTQQVIDMLLSNDDAVIDMLRFDVYLNLYRSYSKFTKHKLFYLALFRNPEHNTKRLLEKLQLEHFRNIISNHSLKFDEMSSIVRDLSR